jgi:hypothetical protein
MAEQEQKLVVGVCSGITEKPTGWFDFEISVAGKEYPVRCSSNDADIINAVRELKGSTGTFTINEVESDKINPRSNRPYINRYLQKVEAGDTAPTSTGAPGTPDPHHEPVHDADRQRLITRQTCLKVAAQRHHPIDGDDWALQVMKDAQRFETWLYRDIDPAPFE